MRDLIRKILKEEILVEMPAKLTQSDFINRSNIVHQGKFDYSLVDYKNTSTPVKIICPVHGEFEQRPNDHLRGVGCRLCGYGEAKRKTTRSQEDFIKKAEEKHNGKYSYEKTKYVNANTNIIITCPTHGDFSQNPNQHLRGQGCLKCAGKYMDQDMFVDKAKQVHGNKYDYSKVVYTNSSTPVKIVCPEHGEFMQAPTNHLSQKQGCPVCGIIKRNISNTTTQDEVIDLFQNVHGDQYDYSLVDYKGMNKNVDIICRKHGPFSVRPANHLYLGTGCPICMESRGEKFIRNILTDNNIQYITQKQFDDCQTISNKGKCTKLRFDFYLPEYNTVIEYDGIQHHEPVEVFGGLKNLEVIQRRDEIKNQYCRDNGIKMIRVSYKIPFNEISDYILSQLDN
jgi:hypothetical protein